MSSNDKNNWLGGSMFMPSGTTKKEGITTSLSKLDNYVVFDNSEPVQVERRGRSRSISESDFGSTLNVPKNNHQKQVNSNLLSSFLLGASQGKRSSSLSASRDGNMLNQRRLSESFGSGGTVNTKVTAMGLLNFSKNNPKPSNVAVSSIGQPKLSDLLTNALSLNKNLMAKEHINNSPVRPQTKQKTVSSSNCTPVFDGSVASMEETHDLENKLAGNSSQLSSTTSTKVDLVQAINTPKSIANKFDIDYVEGSLHEDLVYDPSNTPNPQEAVPSGFEELCENSAILSQISSESDTNMNSDVGRTRDFKSAIAHHHPPRSFIENRNHKQQPSMSSQDLQNDLMLLETHQRHHQRQKSLRLVQSVNDLQSPSSHNHIDMHNDGTSTHSGMGIIGYTYADIVDKRMSHISNLSGLSWEEIPVAVRDAHRQLTSNEDPMSSSSNHNSGRQLRKAKSSRELVEKEEEYIDAEMQLNLLKQQQVELKMKQMELQIQELKLTNDKLRYAINDQRQIQDKMIYETLHDTLRTKENMETEMNRKVDLLENKIQEYKDRISRLTDQQDPSAYEGDDGVDAFYESGNRTSDGSTSSNGPTPKSNTPVTRSNSLYVKKNRLSKIDPEQLEEMTKSRNSSRIEHSVLPGASAGSNKMKRMSTISSTSSSNASGYNKKKGVNLNLPIRIDSSTSL